MALISGSMGGSVIEALAGFLWDLNSRGALAFAGLKSDKVKAKSATFAPFETKELFKRILNCPKN